MRVTEHRATTAVAVSGALLLGAAYLLGQQRYGPGGRFSLSQVNGLCASVLGQLAQASSARAGANCSSVATSEQAHGWLIVAGVLALAGALAWAIWLQARERLS